MANIETWFEQDLMNPVTVRNVGSIFSQDSLGNLIGVRVKKDGEDFTLSGSVNGYCILADGSTVPVIGTRSGNTVSIILPASAYSVTGPIAIAIKLTDGNAITTLAACVGIVTRSRTGVQIDPGQTVTDWTNQIAAALQEVIDTSAAQDVKINDLKSAITNGTFTEKSENLFCPMFGLKYDNATATIDGDKVTVTATADRTYCSARMFIDVHGIDKITVSYNNYSGTGSGRIRIGYSTDGQTHGGWIGTVDSNPKTFNVSGYDYIDVYLYAVYSTNQGLGNYITYDSIMINTGESATSYAPMIGAKDTTARNNIADTNKRLEAAEENERLSDRILLYGETTLSSVAIQGEMTSTGYKSHNTRACTPNILVMPFDVTIKTDNAHRFRVLHYINGEYQTYEDWSISKKITAFSEFTIVMRDSPEASAVTFDLSACVSAFSVVYEVGANVYYGEKVSLTNEQYCDIVTWKDFMGSNKGSQYPDITAYGLTCNQSMAIYGNYVFLLQSGSDKNNVSHNGECTVVDYATKEIIGKFTVDTPTTVNHQNSAQFSSYYYDENDEFPLLVVSRCGGYYPANPSGQENYNGALFYRITKANNAFSATLVNTVLFNHVTYGLSWGIDTVFKKIYAVTYVNAAGSVAANNPLEIFSFNMPSAEDILSGNTVTLGDNDIVSHFSSEHIVLQGCCAVAGRIYLAITDETQSRKANIIVYDVGKKSAITRVLLSNNLEAEGVAIYNNRLYVGQRRSANYDPNDNPLMIQEISF